MTFRKKGYKGAQLDKNQRPLGKKYFPNWVIFRGYFEGFEQTHHEPFKVLAKRMKG